MTALKNKIDFALVFTVRNANPNGDPLDGNRPRTTYEGLGEVSDVCLKRKIRNRWLDEGNPIFVQSDDRRSDDYLSLKDRADSINELKACYDSLTDSKKGNKDKKTPPIHTSDEYIKIACKTWLDVRAFGQVFAFSEDKKDENKDSRKKQRRKKGYPLVSAAP